MTGPGLACPRCGRICLIERRAGREVAVGTVAAASEVQPTLVCPEHGPVGSALTYTDAAAALAHMVFARRRVMRGADRCDGCGATMTMPVRRTVRPVTVAAPDVAPFTVTFDVPSSRCPACGLDQVPTRSQDDVREALRTLFP
jgi:hypothetical protein